MTKTMKLREAFRDALHSRVFVTLWAVIILQMIIFLALLFAAGRLGEPGTPVRFDGFSATGISLDNGSYLINFAVMAIIMPAINIFVSLKLYAFRGRPIALAVLWLTVVIFVIAMVFVAALLGLGNIR